MKLHKAIKTLERRRDYLSNRTQMVNSDGARNWDNQEKIALERVFSELGYDEPQPDMNDLRAFRKIEGNVI